jgi:hypothetical protein
MRSSRTRLAMRELMSGEAVAAALSFILDVLSSKVDRLSITRR